MHHDAAERACTRQLSSLAGAQSWQGACQALHGMALRRLRRNVFGDSAAISACEKGKQWKVAAGRWVKGEREILSFVFEANSRQLAIYVKIVE